MLREKLEELVEKRLREKILHIVSFAQKERLQNHLKFGSKFIFVFSTALLIVAVSTFLSTNLTGRFIFTGQAFNLTNYTDYLDVAVDQSQEYNWTLGNFCTLENCTLKSISVSGSISANQSGTVHIFIENFGKQYLIFNKSLELNKTFILQNITAEQNTTVVNVSLEQPEVFYFNDSCVETCNLTDVFNESSYKIIFNQSANISTKINSISYSWAQKVFEPIEEKAALNFSSDKIKEVKGSSTKNVVARIERQGKNELWFFDLEEGKKIKIGFRESAPGDFPVGLKDKFVFWLSEDFKTLFVFDTSNKHKLQFAVPTFDWEKGERARVKLPNTAWEVVVDIDKFYFYSKDTGEVFSDDDQAARELFRKTNNLDLFLTKEEKSALGFEVERSEDEE
jgi:hypothetical protein